jgi:CheY-like chemotaxis protein
MWDLKPPVLICEDDPNDAHFLERTLRKVGVANPIYIARDGEDAIDYLAGKGKYSNRKQFPFPSVIVTDLKMPRKNGFEVLEWLDNHPDCAVIPSIVWSSSALAEDVKKAYELGANCYLQKPSRPEDWEHDLKALFQFWNICQLPSLSLSSCAEGNPPGMK